MPEFVSHGAHHAVFVPGQKILVMQYKGNKQIGFCLKTNFMCNSVSAVGAASVLSQSEQLLSRGPGDLVSGRTTTCCPRPLLINVYCSNISLASSSVLQRESSCKPKTGSGLVQPSRPRTHTPAQSTKHDD